jgi:hypothetical protein
MSRMSRSTAITIVGLTVIAGMVAYASLDIVRHRCEVCIAFDGREMCRTVESASEEEAQMGATTNACALLASGVTDSMRCQRTLPTRTACEQTP